MDRLKVKDNQDLETYGCDLHNEIFNTDKISLGS